MPDWPGRWRRQELPEMRKKALLVNWRAGEASLGWPKVARVRERPGASIYKRGKAVPRRPWISFRRTDVL